MNTHDSRSRHIIRMPLLLAMFGTLVLAFGFPAGTAQSDEEDRKFENGIPAHVPLKVKVKNEQVFKDRKNKNWLRDLEIEVKNTSEKPIYFMFLVMDLPDVRNEAGHSYAVQLHYGRKELVDPGAPLLPDDVPVPPGGSITLTVPERQVKGYESYRRMKNKADPRKVQLDMQLINFGDGTGLQGKTGTPTPVIPRRQASNTPVNRDGAACIPPPRGQPERTSLSLLNSELFERPVSFLRVSFFSEDNEPTAGSTTNLLPDLCGC